MEIATRSKKHSVDGAMKTRLPSPCSPSLRNIPYTPLLPRLGRSEKSTRQTDAVLLGAEGRKVLDSYASCTPLSASIKIKTPAMLKASQSLLRSAERVLILVRADEMVLFY